MGKEMKDEEEKQFTREEVTRIVSHRINGLNSRIAELELEISILKTTKNKGEMQK